MQLFPDALTVGLCRLRVCDDLAGIGPPLFEDQTLSDAGLTQGQKLIIEPGPVPLKCQVSWETENLV